MKGLNGQLRDHETKTTLATPDTAALETADVHVQTDRVDINVRNVEMILFLEEEERGVAFLAKTRRMLFAQLDDLLLLQTQPVEIRTEEAEHLSERCILDHFMDGNIRYSHGLSAFVQAPTCEETFDVGFEYAFLFTNEPRTVARSDGNRFIFKEAAKDRLDLRLRFHTIGLRKIL